jgi:hypothetical protein
MAGKTKKRKTAAAKRGAVKKPRKAARAKPAAAKAAKTAEPRRDIDLLRSWSPSRYSS